MAITATACLALINVAGIALAAWLCRAAPEACEDEAGFHIAPSPIELQPGRRAGAAGRALHT
jgi:hypothetical protein